MCMLKILFARLLLAASLLAGAGHAFAADTYRVTIDTASLGNGSAFLGLYFLGLGSAAPATATVTSLAGAFDGAPELAGAVSGAVPGPLVFGNGGDFVQAVTLGGTFSFDVALAFGTGGDGSTFGWALFDATRYLGADGDLGRLLIQPDAPPGARVTVAQLGTIGSVSAVPEPSSVVLVVLGLAVLAARWCFGRRRSIATPYCAP